MARSVQAHLMQSLKRAEARIAAGITAQAQRHGLSYDGNTASLQSLLSELTRRAGFTLPDLVRLVRGETPVDPRPNKALNPNTYTQLLHGYSQQAQMIDIAQNGFRAKWRQAVEHQPQRPPNHRSAIACADQVLERIREGEATGAYLVVDADIFEQWVIHVSPFGAIAKSDDQPDAIRLIHDLSCPRGDCPNDLTDTSSLPALSYEPIAVLAKRIEQLRQRFPHVRILMLKGDVHGAYRHLRHHADDVVWMCGRTPDYTGGVVDLSAPFGWTGSPALYGIFGGAVCYLVGHESPATLSQLPDADTEPFFAYAWVDDHIMIEPDIEERCVQAEDALRLSMLAVLGPRAINESKFTQWAPSLSALGLDWDTAAATVSIPPDKIAKALDRVHAARDSQRISKHTLERLLGSLRHVSSCLHAARPFYQRLHTLARFAPRHGSVNLSAWARDDLNWFEHILQAGRLRGIPTRLFGKLSNPDVHLYMDASNAGLCVLDPATKRYIMLQFDAEERSLMAGRLSASTFDINVREHLCVALAATILAPVWCSALAPWWPHIRCWTDNITAMSRTNSLSGSSAYSQELNRCIGLAEAVHGFRISAAHLPGTSNTLADAGSRCPSPATVPVQVILTDLQAASLADSSRATYDRTWKQWCTWRQQLGKAPHLPRNHAEQSTELIDFALACWTGKAGNRANTASTVLSKLSHISWHHLIRYGFEVTVEPAHALALRGMRRLSRAPRRKSPATPEILQELRRALDFSRTRDRVIWGATVVGYFFLLRRSEYLAVDGKISRFALQRSDVKFTDRHGKFAMNKEAAFNVSVRIRGSKTDQLGESTLRTLARSGSKWLCPVLAAWALVGESKQARFAANEPLRRLREGPAVSAADLANQIKKAARACGEDGRNYGTHSLRSGGATALFAAGSNETTVKLHGRWRSNCFQRYVHIDRATSNDAAAQMLGHQTNSKRTEATSPAARYARQGKPPLRGGRR